MIVTVTGGSGAVPIPSSGSGEGDQWVGIGEIKNIPSIDEDGINVLVYIDAELIFDLGDHDSKYTLQILSLNMSNGDLQVKFLATGNVLDLKIGESLSIDLDQDGQDDVELKYNELLINRIDLSLSKIATATINDPKEEIDTAGLLVK